MLVVLVQNVCNWQHKDWALTITLSLSLLTFPLSLIFFGIRSSITLLLPRVAGGIAIGYFPLLIATEPWYLVVSALTCKNIWLLEWVGVLFIVWGYLYREVYPFIIDRREAIWRSFKVTVWATVQAVVIGFLLILFSTPVYRQLEVTPDPTLAQIVSKYEREKSPQSSETQYSTDNDQIEQSKISVERVMAPTASKIPFISAMSALRISDYFPIAALLTFAPISLLLGIILQILWEEKPITASVWLPESR